MGRSSSCQVTIQDVADLSREHCGIRRYEDGSYTLVDFGSRNGTFLNGEQVFEEKPIQHCDTIRLGKYVEIGFTNPPRKAARPDPMHEASQVLLRSAPTSYPGVKTLASEDLSQAPDRGPTPTTDPSSADLLEEFRRAVQDR